MPGSRHQPATCDRLCLGAPPARAAAAQAYFRETRRGVGPHPQTARPPMLRSKRRSAPRWPTSRSGRCVGSRHLAPAVCSNCSVDLRSNRGLGLDLRARTCLLLARDRLERAGLKNCSVRQGDLYDLPLADDSFDVVILHQVLHFLGRRRPRHPRGGRARCVRAAVCWLSTFRAARAGNSCASRHAHRRLGFPPETLTQMDDGGGARTCDA